MRYHTVTRENIGPDKTPETPNPQPLRSAMELSFPTRSLTALLPNRAPITAPNPSLLLPRPLSSSKPFTPLSKSGYGYRDVRAMASEERSSFVSEKFGVSPNETVVVDKIEEPQAEAVAAEKEETVVVDGEQSEPAGFLNKLDLKLDSDDTYSILVYGTGALVALWLSSAVVGAIDSIPVFPKVMEVVGLAYTIWFSYRYLIFKQNREELLAKIEDLRQQIIGTTDD